MMINKELKEYIEKNIFPEYNKNDKGHGIDHIAYVIGRSLKFASTVEDIDYNMVYAIAAYHDIAHHIDAKHHEELGAKILLEDNNLKKFFNDKFKLLPTLKSFVGNSTVNQNQRNIFAFDGRKHCRPKLGLKPKGYAWLPVSHKTCGKYRIIYR